MKGNTVIFAVLGVAVVMFLCLCCAVSSFAAYSASSPTDKKVCEKVVDLYEKEIGDLDIPSDYGDYEYDLDSQFTFTVDDCLKSLDDTDEELNRSERNCIMDAKTLSDIDKCDFRIN